MQRPGMRNSMKYPSVLVTGDDDAQDHQLMLDMMVTVCTDIVNQVKNALTKFKDRETYPDLQTALGGWAELFTVVKSKISSFRHHQAPPLADAMPTKKRKLYQFTHVMFHGLLASNPEFALPFRVCFYLALVCSCKLRGKVVKAETLKTQVLAEDTNAYWGYTEFTSQATFKRFTEAMFMLSYQLNRPDKAKGRVALFKNGDCGVTVKAWARLAMFDPSKRPIRVHSTQLRLYVLARYYPYSIRTLTPTNEAHRGQAPRVYIKAFNRKVQTPEAEGSRRFMVSLSTDTRLHSLFNIFRLVGSSNVTFWGEVFNDDVQRALDDHHLEAAKTIPEEEEKHDYFKEVSTGNIDEPPSTQPLRTAASLKWLFLKPDQVPQFDVSKYLPSKFNLVVQLREWQRWTDESKDESKGEQVIESDQDRSAIYGMLLTIFPHASWVQMYTLTNTVDSFYETVAATYYDGLKPWLRDAITLFASLIDGQKLDAQDSKQYIKYMCNILHDPQKTGMHHGNMNNWKRSVKVNDLDIGDGKDCNYTMLLMQLLLLYDVHKRKAVEIEH